MSLAGDTINLSPSKPVSLTCFPNHPALPAAAITLLRKLCNTPDQLLSKEAAEDGEEGDAAGAAATDSVIQQLRGSFPKDFEPGLKASSGKLVGAGAASRAAGGYGFSDRVGSRRSSCWVSFPLCLFSSLCRSQLL